MWLRSSFLITLGLLLGLQVLAQVSPAPAPSPSEGSRRAPPRPASDRNFDRLRSIEMMIPKDRAGTHPLLDPKTGIYRTPGKSEIAILGVPDASLSRYAAFLNGPNTGIVKLSAESSCITDEDVITVSEKCAPFKMPGAGTAFSFRTETYRLPRLADIILVDGVFRTGGVFQQVVIGQLGDVAIEDVTLNSKSIRYLVELQPVQDTDAFVEFGSKNSKGTWSEGVLYRVSQRARPDTTYALRSIAYRGNFIRSIDGIPYDELEFDKRRDVIVAFRVVEQDPAGNITILWKRLKDVEAPKLKVKK